MDEFNTLVQVTNGEILIFFDEPLVPMGTDWVHALAGHAMRPEIGLVGSKIVDEFGHVDDTRLILALDALTTTGAGTPDAVNAAGNKIGYFGRWMLDHRVPTLSGGCFAVRRNVFEGVGGFDARLRSPTVRVVDLSQRVSQYSLGLLWSAQAKFLRPVQPNAKQPPSPSDIRQMLAKWGTTLDDRLCENPNLALSGTCQQLLFPPRKMFPWRKSAIRAAA
jgi:hypothetical protein